MGQVHTLENVVPAPATIEQPPRKDPQMEYPKIVPQSEQKYMYALTIKPTIFVSHIRQFWSTASIETTDEGTHILATVDGIQRTVSEASLRRNLKLRDEDGIVSIPDMELFKNLTLMVYNISQNQKITFQKVQFSHQWKYLIHTIVQCLSPKSTGFNEFNSNIATALVCLATNRTYNFSKMIFDGIGMVKNVNNKGEGSGTPTEPHHTPSPAVTSSHPSTSSIPLPSIPTAPIPLVTQTGITPIIQYTKRARIAQHSYKLGMDQLEVRIAEYKEREVKYIETIRSLERYKECNLGKINKLTSDVETLQDKKDLADGKLARLLKSSKDLEDIIESHRSEKVKEGLGYNDIPPPAADLYLSPKKDISWIGLPEFLDNTVTDYTRPSPSVASTSAEDQNNDTSTSEETTSTNPSKSFIKFVKPKDSQPKSKIEE
nr:synaptobrevin, longin-like domain protein [Tanacetum cinerariifolium]